MSAITCTRAPVAPAAVARLPARRAQRLVVRAATALPAEVRSRVWAYAGGQCATMQAPSPAPHASRPSPLPTGEDRLPRGGPCACEGRGGGGQDRGRHPAAQQRAEAADAGHRLRRRLRQGRQGGCCGDPALARPPPLPHPCSSCNCRLRAQAGDKVVYSKYAGTELEVQGDTLVLLKVR